jgi:hypothetical protein
MSLAAIGFSSVIFWIIALLILWPISLAYVIHVLFDNSKITTIATISILAILGTFALIYPTYAPDIFVTASVISVGLAGLLWMFDMCS